MLDLQLHKILSAGLSQEDEDTLDDNLHPFQQFLPIEYNDQYHYHLPYHHHIVHQHSHEYCTNDAHYYNLPTNSNSF